MQLAPPAWSEREALWRRALQPVRHVAALASDDGRSAAEKHLHAFSADVEPFEIFFRRYNRDIFGYLWRMIGEEQTARDLTQETFLRAWQQFEKIRTYDRPSAWLFRVATHLAINHMRSGAVINRVFGRIALDQSVVSRDPANQVAEQDAIRCVLLALSPRERAALVLHEIFGLSCAELAEALSISLSAAK